MTERSLCIQCASANGYICETLVLNFLSHDTYTYSHSPIPFFYCSCAPSSLRNAKPTGWIGAGGDGWVAGGERVGSCERQKVRAVKREVLPSRTSSLRRDKNFSARCWKNVATARGRKERWVEKPRWKIAVETIAALVLRPRKRTCRVSRRRKRCVSCSVRDFFFNVTLKCSHYDLRSSSWMIPWEKRKMREKSELQMKYYTLFRQNAKSRLI